MGACVCAPTARNKVLAKEEEEGWEKVEDVVFSMVSIVTLLETSVVCVS